MITKKNVKPYKKNIQDTDTEKVINFPYLEQAITENGGNEEIKRRISIVKTTFAKMSTALTFRTNSVYSGKRIVQFRLSLTLQHGVKIWTSS